MRDQQGRARLNLRRLDVSSHGDVPALVHEIRRQRGLEAEVLTPRQRELTMRLFGEPLPPVRSVERICREVQELGFSAVARFSRLLDEYELTPERLRVTEAELQEAHAKVSAEFLRTVRHVRERLFTFQTGLLYSDVVWRQNGEEIRVRYRPVRRVGIHIPGGSAAYPSTLLMTVVPAQAAGVREIAVIAPPTRFGSNNPELLAVCYELGIREVYRLGGAHGIAALAYGMEGLPRVDMIVGPGNLFVTLAKKYVFGTVGIDLLAGPTEVVILADDSAHPQYLAADLLAQAEHAPGSSILITWRAELLDAVQHALEEQLRCLERGELTRDSLERFGAFVRTQDADQAVDLANLLAPEHLQVCARQAEALLERVENAGAVFLGNTTPEAVGDYLAGPSHVLPTGGTARFASGLSANDFLRRTSVIRFDATALRREAEHIIRLATVEHLPAHAESVRVRLADFPSSAAPAS